MKPTSSPLVGRIIVAALLFYGCGSDTLGGATGTGGGSSSGTTGNGGAAGTSAGGTSGSGGTTGSAGVTGFGGGAGTFGPIQCGFPESTRCPAAQCGNGVRDTCSILAVPADCDMRFTEWCDGDDLGAATCASRGLGSGTLRCTSDCGFDTSGCSGAQGGRGGGAGGADACDPQPPPSFTTNYVTDPGFENGGSGWSVNGGTFAVTASTFHCGTHSGAVTSRNYARDGFTYNPVLSGYAVYTFSMWVMHNGASNLPLSVQGLGLCSDSTMGFGGVDQSIAPNRWTRLTGTLTVGGGCSGTLQVFQQSGSGSQLPDLFIDDVYIVK